MSTPSYRLAQINILPAEYRRRLLSTLQLALILLILVEAAGFYYVQQTRAGARQEVARLQADQVRIGFDVTQLEPLLAEANTLRGQVSELEAQVAKLKSGTGNIQAQRVDWPAILGPLATQLPEGMSLTSIDKVGSKFNIAGVSTKGAEAVNLYHQQLTRSPQIKKVTIQDMRTRLVQGKPPAVIFTILVEAAVNDIPQA